MKKNEIEELQKATIKELEEKSFNLRKELFNLRTKQKLGQLKNFASLGLLRRDIARVETIIKSRNNHKKNER